MADLVHRIPDSDLKSLLQTGGVPIISLRIPPWNWWNEALHGIQSKMPPISETTVFPAPLTTAASFNKTLFHTVGVAESVEARAVYNTGGNQLTDWSPNINLVRDVRWGRGAETPGECPYLTSRYAIDYVRGMQGYPPFENTNSTDRQAAPHLLRVSSCLKHFFAYDGPEDWGANGVNSSGAKTRFDFNAKVTARDLADSYLPGFEAGARPDLGAASGVMCSYNEVNGVPTCAHKDMLTAKLREQWGFRGYVVSDCGAMQCIGPSCSAGRGHCREIAPEGSAAFYACMNVSGHNYSMVPDQITASVFKAGLDINCGAYVPAHLTKALADGAVSRRDMNVALTHLFDVLFRLGLFETEAAQPLSTAGVADVGTAAHRQIALEAAVQGAVLLTNHNETLPLSVSKHQSVALVGHSECKLGPYSPEPRTNDKLHACDLADALDATAAVVTRAPTLSAACQQITSAVIGVLDTDCEGESHDRQTIGPVDADAQMLAHIAMLRKEQLCAPGMPLILVVLGACATDLTDAVASFDAILWAGAGGERGGEAIARLLYGADVPSGRLPITMYTREVEKMSLFDMNMRPSADYPGRTYRFHTGPQVFPAFHGLSYTVFSYSLAADIATALSAQSIDATLRNRSLHRFSAPRLAVVHATIRNTGRRAAPTSVLAFAAGPKAGTAGEPLRELVGFDKVWLDPKNSVVSNFDLSAWELSSTDIDGTRRATIGKWMITVADARVVLDVTK
eukprot:SAG31_NODE_3667_length_4007_cov_1.970317_2_plen_737_part_00